MPRLRAVLPLLLLVSIGIALFASGALERLSPEHLADQQVQLAGMIQASPWLARSLFVGLLTLVVATGIPGTLVLTLAGGMFFGILGGTILSTVGLELGSLILFLASRYAFAHSGSPPPKLAVRVREGYLRHPLSYTLFLRLIPVFPFGAVTVALAWLRCPLWLFLTASGVGGCVMLIFESAIGAGLAQSLAAGHPVDFNILLQPRVLIPMLALALLALVPMAFGKNRRALQAGSLEQDREDRMR